MKNSNSLFIFCLIALSIISCGEPQSPASPKEENQVGIIKGDDFRSKSMFQFTEAYIKNDLNSVAEMFTPDAKIMLNDAVLTFPELVEDFSSGHAYFENIHHEDNDAFTMHYQEGTAAGNIFTHYWYTWKGTVKKTGEDLSIKGYSWMKWNDDKVEAMYNAFDPTLFNANVADPNDL